MPEHYTRKTLECTAYCNVCKSPTQHRVDGGRRGPCLEHAAPQYSHAQLVRMGKEKKRKRLEEEAKRQPSLLFPD
jgi:hypothetical protein